MAGRRRLGLHRCAPPTSGAADMAEVVAVDIGTGVIAIVLASGLTLFSQKTRRHLKNGRIAEFLCVHAGESCAITLNTSPRGMISSSSEAKGTRVMTHNDAYAVFEIYQMVDRVGGSVDLYEPDSPPPADRVEFCLGGPRSNRRTEDLLKEFLPNISMRDALISDRVPDPSRQPQDIILEDDPENPTRFECKRDHREYVILARVMRHEPKKCIFIVAGQTSITNHAAMYFLKRNLDKLHHRFGNRSFCLILYLRDSEGKYYENVDERVAVSM